ncbi:MAG TPA: ATP-dependent RNA helicase HrpA [Steroidobacteraceae bacterium]|nr:ATP-dependent RNA helicase HrpA [Steroidobacteraceae bacterium]
MPNEAPARDLRPLVFKHDPDLPITASRERILEALEHHQVLIVAGDTGSGKSTQLPQYCLELGRGREARIAHTQPRRLAARALAARIAEELSEPLGATVGFRVRFADQVSQATRLVLMTDGLLLAELAADRELKRYDTVIVDEAHERSLNVDLLLGVIKRLLPRRPELRLIVTSATLAVERVARFFDAAPVLSISGRGYPIEVRYTVTAEAAESEDPDLPATVLEAYRDIATTPGALGNGDVLVFLPGEREIRDVAELLEREVSDAEVLTLYSRLSWERQSRIFKRGARRRIVLATNVAETSITVPGIRAVIDSGLARISRYSPRSRLQRLPIEPISRASADQRKGRCGRIGPGLCLRLYSPEDFDARPEHTEPEILRTNLAALLLRLAADGLGDAETFPFIDAPDTRALNDGYRLLQELEALNEERQVTARGRAMARLPLDPRLARALLESRRFHAETELLAIVSGLSVPDARLPEPEHPAAEESGAETAFEDSRSEFDGLVKLWRAYRQMREGPRRELRRWCKERRLSLTRLSEWEDVHAQVSDRARTAGIVGQRKPAGYAAIHRSLLSGFCTTVGVRGEEGDYLGTRGIRFHIFPGSPLRRRKPRWVMAANIVETSRVFARTVAEVEPMWIEAAARHLCRREFLEPDWDERRGEVVARERVTFLGLTLSANRIVNYGPIAPEESRRIFAREALVHGRLEQRPPWLEANDAAIREAERLEERLRVRDLRHPAEHFVDFYASVLPRQVSSAASLAHFTRHLTESERSALELGPQQIFARRPDPAMLERFPQIATLGELRLPVEYRFEPGDPTDGVTLEVPLLVLPVLTRSAADASIPGLAEPRIEAALRSLPKEVRRHLIPIGATAQSFLSFIGAPSADLAALGVWLHETRAIPVERLRFDPTQIPAHLVPRIAVLGARDVIASGAVLKELRRQTALEARRELDRRAHAVYPEPWRRFELPELPETLRLDLPQGPLPVFPTLKRVRGAIEVRLEWSAQEAARSYGGGAVHLARAMLERQMRDLAKVVAADMRLLLAASPYFSREDLIDLLLQLSCRRACFDDLDPPRAREAFEAAVDRGRAQLHELLEQAIAEVGAWITEARGVRRLLEDPRARTHAPAAAETQAHLVSLLRADFLQSLPADWLRQVTRYVKAEERRWQRIFARGTEPPQVLAELGDWTSRFKSLETLAAAELRHPPELEELGLWIEEYRVSLYAQELKTRAPVSAARLLQREAEILAWLGR